MIGFVCGILATLGGVFCFIRHHGQQADEIARKIMGTSDRFDPGNRLAQALAELRDAKSDYERWLALTDVCFLEVDGGLYADSRKHAQTLLTQSAKYRNDWNFGNALHKGNLTLGRLALREQDIGKAKYYLLEAGKTPGSPQLDSFGPNMVLARELLERGERETVLQYFDLCGRFWEMGHDKLKEWTALVKAGITPDFGPNLLY